MEASKFRPNMDARKQDWDAHPNLWVVPPSQVLTYGLSRQDMDTNPNLERVVNYNP